MFTGLIEEIGLVKSLHHSPSGMVVEISAQKILSEVKLGDSVAVNGACQTVIDFGKDFFKVEASNETLAVTNFQNLKIGDNVNLELAMRLSDRLGGHLVTGHVDCVATFKSKISDGFSCKLAFEIPELFLKYIVKKGAVAINGISLTIVDIKQNVIFVEIIPHTLKNTNLQSLKIGDIVNIEVDEIGKYIEKIYLASNNVTGKITQEFLSENGFV